MNPDETPPRAFEWSFNRSCLMFGASWMHCAEWPSRTIHLYIGLWVLTLRIFSTRKLTPIATALAFLAFFAAVALTTPGCTPRELSFNLSHTADAVVVATAKGNHPTTGPAVISDETAAEVNTLDKTYARPLLAQVRADAANNSRFNVVAYWHVIQAWPIVQKMQGLVANKVIQ